MSDMGCEPCRNKTCPNNAAISSGCVARHIHSVGEMLDCKCYTDKHSLEKFLSGAEQETLFTTLFLCVRELGWDMAISKPENDDEPVIGMVIGTMAYVDRLAGEEAE